MRVIFSNLVPTALALVAFQSAGFVSFAAAAASAPDASLLAARSSHDLVARARSFGLAGRQRFGKGSARNFRQIQDPTLDPGSATGQGQNSGPQGVGQQSMNTTSGLPNGIANFNDPQKNLFLDPSQIAQGLASDGSQGGQFTPSLTSTNNFINFCLTRNDLPLTNGNQVKTGSCNAVPMGIIAAQTAMPSSKFQNPKNLDTIPANTDFTIQMAINNLQTGNFVNAQSNYYSAPQQTNGQGQIIGHSHVVIEQIDSLTSTTVTDPTKFAFFKGLNDPAANGVLSATVTGGLPAGVYKMSSINAASNHQPALVAVAQHGSLDDAVYFTVSDGTNANASASGAGGSAAAAGSSAAAASAATLSTTASSGAGQSQGGNRQRRSDRSARFAPERRLERTLAALVDVERA